MSRADCCTHNCRSGRDCPLRQPRDLTRFERFVGYAVVVIVGVVLVSSLAERIAS